MLSLLWKPWAIEIDDKHDGKKKKKFDMVIVKHYAKLPESMGVNFITPKLYPPQSLVYAT